LENVDIFYGPLEYLTDIWDILSLLGTLCVHLVHFPVLVSFCIKKNLATLVQKNAEATKQATKHVMNGQISLNSSKKSENVRWKKKFRSSRAIGKRNFLILIGTTYNVPPLPV
jgi:hypothetical protein